MGEPGEASPFLSRYLHILFCLLQLLSTTSECAHPRELTFLLVGKSQRGCLARSSLVTSQASTDLKGGTLLGAFRALHSILQGWFCAPFTARAMGQKGW